MPSPPGPADPPAGLLGALLDRSFDHMVTLSLARVLYTAAVVCVTGVNVALFLVGWWLVGSWLPFLGWVIVIGTPVLWLAEVLVIRVVVEFMIVQHKISQDLVTVREAVKDLRAGQTNQAGRPGEADGPGRG